MYSTADNLRTFTWFVHFELPFRLKGTEKIHTERLSKSLIIFYSLWPKACKFNFHLPSQEKRRQLPTSYFNLLHLLPPTLTYFHLLQTTPTYSYLLPPSPTYSHLLLPTPTCSTYYHLLPPIHKYSYLLPLTPIYSHLLPPFPPVPTYFLLLQPTHTYSYQILPTSN